jgi:hypothetical protein
MLNKLTLFLLTIIVSCWSSIGATSDLPIPPRVDSALTGSELYNEFLSLSQSAREQEIYRQTCWGNVPDFQRDFISVTITKTISGTPHTAVIEVAPDYFCLGSDEDFFRLPMSAELAQWIADRTDCVLPTRLMVNEIYTSASVKLAPSFFNPANYNINSLEVFWQHNVNIEEQRAGQPLGHLVGGIKKDIVSSTLIAQYPNRVVIYGWHQLNGSPIQPLSKVHSSTYMDYSHGVRLVKRIAMVDGEPRPIPEILADSVLHPLLSDEGVFSSTDYPTSTPPSVPFPAGWSMD